MEGTATHGISKIVKHFVQSNSNLLVPLPYKYNNIYYDHINVCMLNVRWLNTKNEKQNKKKVNVFHIHIRINGVPINCL